MGYNIAIDGPAGAGKSTIAKKVAKKMGYIYVDTGAMYRAMAVYFIKKEILPTDRQRIINTCEDAHIRITYENELQQLFLNDENITLELRSEEVGNMASIISAIPEVRAHLLALQIELAKQNNVVMDGRDIGSFVLPNADLKIFLTATVETRAKRRYSELIEKGISCSLNDIIRDIEERDNRDISREISPLKQAVDAMLVDSSQMTIEEVVDTILGACTWNVK